MVVGGQVVGDDNQREHLSDAKFGVANTTDDKLKKKPAAGAVGQGPKRIRFG